MMLTELCDYLKNWFVVEMLFGDFKIDNGVITYADGTELPLQVGQYFYIRSGSIHNLGVITDYQQADYENTSLTDEVFNGSVWTMAIPKELLDKAEVIAEWCEKNRGIDSAAMSPFTSESWGGYSCSKDVNSTEWQKVFGPDLARYRKA